jgi:hypothetical protein
MSIKVFTAEELLEAVKNNAAKPVLDIQKKKEDKQYKGTRFLNVKFNIGSHTGATGWFAARGMKLTIGVANPADKSDKRNDYDGTRLQFQTTVSNAGAFGQAVLLLNPIYMDMISKLSKSGVAPLGNRQIHELLQTKVAASNEKAAGAPIDDPIIRMKVDFSLFPMNFPIEFLRGQPRTQIFDFATQYKDEKGKTQYKLAMIKHPKTGEEVLVDKDNLHLFATKGAIIHEARIMWNSVAYSSTWASFPYCLNRVIMSRGPPEGFSDEDVDIAAIESALAPPVEPVVPIVPVVQVPAVVIPGTQPATEPVNTQLTDDDIEGALGVI